MLVVNKINRFHEEIIHYSQEREEKEGTMEKSIKPEWGIMPKTWLKKMTRKLNIIITQLLVFVPSCAIWLWNMFSYIKGGIQAKGIWKQDPEAKT